MSVELDRLDAMNVATMISGMLAIRTPPPAIVDFLVQRSSGNPFFVAEYLRAAIAEGMLRRDHTGAWALASPAETAEAIEAALPLPSSLATLIDRRLQDLDDGGRTVVQAAAVLGREFSGELLMDTAALAGAAGMDALESMRVHQILEEAEEGRLRFVHDKIREVAYGKIPGSQRSDLHRRAAEAIEQRHAAAPDFPLVYASLAHHYAKAEVHTKASLYLQRAGDRARAAYSNGEAIAFYRAALEEGEKAVAASGDPGGEWTAASSLLHEHLGDVLALVGKHEETRRAYAEALARDPTRPDEVLPPSTRVRRARVQRKMGKSWEGHHGHREALDAYERAEGLLGKGADEASWWHEWVQIQIERLWSLYFMSNVDEMLTLVERVRPVIGERGTPHQRAHFFQSLTTMSMRRDRYVVSAETVTHGRTSVAAAEESGDLGTLSLTRFVFAFALLFHGDIDEAGEQMVAALQGAERIGDVTLQSRCLTYLTLVHRKRGAADDTHSAATRSLATATASRMMDYVGAARANLAWAAWRQDDRAEAAREAEAAWETWKQLSPVYTYPFQWTGLWILLACRIDQARVGDAVDFARAMLVPSQQRLPDGIAAALEEAASAFDNGDPPRAEGALRRALEAAGERGYL
jgi:tetratricopeptide (TPR) repeat protein